MASTRKKKPTKRKPASTPDRKRAVTKPANVKSAKKRATAKPRPLTAAERYALDTRDPAALVPLYEALCAWVGRESVDAAVAKVDANPTPYLYMRQMASNLPQLADKLAPAADRNVLAFLLHPKNDRDVVHVGEDDDYPGTGVIRIDPERFAMAGREILDTGRLVTMRGKAVIATSGMNGGNLWEIDAKQAIDHGSVESLVQRLREQLH